MSMMTRPSAIFRRNGLAAAIAVCAAWLAAPAAAVDGEVLINQARVNAGGITPGDTAGFPVTLSRPGRYKLSGTLTVPASLDGIEVTAPDVTIDLNGFTIRSQVLHGARYGIWSAMAGLRVMNGTVSGFGSEGIYHQAGGRGVVENMRVLSNGSGGSGAGIHIFGAEGGAAGQVRNSTVSGNVFGIYCAYNCLIEQNVVTGNTATGILTSRSLVIGNVMAGNGMQGLWADGVVTTGYGSNIAVGNNGGGAQVSGAIPPVPLHPNFCDPACP